MKNKNETPIRGVLGYYSLSKKDSPIQTDPLGSYTGRSKDPYEKPVQDADDL
jgi:hypothetical protein